MKAAANHTLNYGAAGAIGIVGLLVLDRFGLAPEEQIARDALSTLLVLASAFAVHRLRPIVDALLERLLRWAKGGVGIAILFSLLIPGTAEASPARVVLSCDQESEKLNGETNEIETECADPAIYLDAGIKFDGVILRLNRPREVLVGFSAGLGYGIRFSPTWWTYTASFFSVDLFAGGGYEAREEGPDAVSVHGLLVVTFLNWIGLGGGIQHAFGLANGKDETDWLGTFGVATSF